MEQVPGWAWATLAVTIASLLGVDLFVHRGERAESRRTAAVWSGVWIGAGLLFALFVLAVGGASPAMDYLAAYLIEKSLSLDNLFVFLLIFESLNIPTRSQRTVLSWGVFGALVLRGVFVFLGVAAIRSYHWVVYVFGGILLFAALQTARESPADREESWAARWLARHLPVTDRVHGKRFFVRENGRRVATPLVVAVLGLELTDVVFAVDSVPAALSVTRAEFIVYSSNAFAILGLRSLYLVLAHSLVELRYIHYGIASVLAFAAVKLMLSEWVEIPAWLSIGFIALAVGASVAASLRARRGRAPAAQGAR